MRILKYIFLLLLLGFFALSVFVATQKGDFEVVQSKVIASPRSTVFNYVNDYRNWENFVTWKIDDPQMTFGYGAITAGQGAKYSWTGSDGKGGLKTLKVSDNQYLHQKMEADAMDADIYWTFKDTTGGTKVTWRTKGHLNFAYKVASAFSGGGASRTASIAERSLAALDKSIKYELNTFNIKVDGIVNKTGSYYLAQRFTSKIVNVPKNIRIVMPKLLYFFRKNNMKMYGKPFVIYHTYDRARGLTDMAVCLPVNQKIYLSAGSDMVAGELTGFRALKTTLTGDYSHLPQTWDKAYAYLAEKNLAQDETAKSVAWYNVHFEQEKHPSKWVTSIYVPLRGAAAAVVPPKPQRIPVATQPATTPVPVPVQNSVQPD